MSVWNVGCILYLDRDLCNAVSSVDHVEIRNQMGSFEVNVNENNMGACGGFACYDECLCVLLCGR